MTFDPNWPHGHVTRDGQKVEIVRTNLIGAHPIAAILTFKAGHQLIRQFTEDGEFLCGMVHDLDLINAPIIETQAERNRRIAMVTANGNRYYKSTYKAALRALEIAEAERGDA
jgi:hypothetical protein